MIKEWLSANPIGIEDGLRHDKWCAMMWPRLRLLHELLAEGGSFWMTLDDNEVHRARAILDEIFGVENFVTTVIWHKVYSPKNTARHFSEDHDYLIVYGKDAELWQPNLLPRTEEMEARYSNPDNDPRGVWKSSDLTARNAYSKGKYEIEGPTGKKFNSGSRYWRQSLESLRQMDRDNRIWWGENGTNMPSQKRFLSEVKDGLVPQTIWHYSEAGHTQDAKKELLAVMGYDGEDDVFVTPKPVKLIDRVLRIATDQNSLVLDSFAGSATTAHAVLAANKRDGGNRRFVLVEGEEYADKLTAERTRRVILGYPYKGMLKEELLRERLSFRTLSNPSVLLDKVQGIENLEGHRFDQITKEIVDKELIVTGEKRVAQRAEGLGGAFTYCTLGEPVALDAILIGDALPSFASLGATLFHMATNRAFNPAQMVEAQFYLGETENRHVWLVYRDNLEWLKSPDAALTLQRAKDFAAAKPGKDHLVFAPSRFVSQKLLSEQNIPVEFVPLPFALYRIERAS
jgi:adenine-specific DNA-methyltransferase